MQVRGPVSNTRREGSRIAANLVKGAALEGPQSLAHKLAFGWGVGRAHTNLPGMAEVWLSARTIANIQANELRKFGERIGTRPARKKAR